MAMTRDRVAAQAFAARRTGRVHELAPAQEGPAARAEEHRRAEGNVDLKDRPDVRRSVRRVLQGLPWKRIAALSAALFVLAMVLIVAFELATGRAVSTYTGGTNNTSVGTSIPGWSGTGEVPPDAELDVPLPGEVQDTDPPQEQAPQDAPDEQVPQQEAPQEEAPQEQSPQEDAP
ncbi:hypothetical protein [Ornithinimicrobium pratense]|uniref:Uncharacterized protein n=1 Tax=Ornithinimicrobium pratense TaxID=2593973 RepID=A0A5J6V413_9MICO|nr:hypothetical protein [Ornithinimicrobium pratense]QFG67911.1 hypothetical protein FY030_03510 [Ornithinimicrobium pratense]